MPTERWALLRGNSPNKMEGKDEMTKASGGLQDLRRGIYVKAKAEPSWRFWGLFVHVCKMETLQEAYEMAKKNNGAPGIDGVTFEAIEAQGAHSPMTAPSGYSLACVAQEALLRPVAQANLIPSRSTCGFG